LPLTFVSWEIESLDGKEHDVALTFEVSALLTVNTPDQKVVWGPTDDPRFSGDADRQRNPGRAGARG
jgi:hypothetical protein